MSSILPTLKFIVQHPLSSRRPLSAVWRYARWQVESRLRPEIVFDWIDGSKLVVRNGMTGATGNIYCGLHEFVDMALLLHLLRPGDLFVDIGANIGSYTVLASAVCGARSIAIEPDPDSRRALEKNIEANGVESHVKVVGAALGSRPGKTRFTVGNDTTNRVATETDFATREVEVRTLDEILQSEEEPVLIKMDVEGYEPEVVAGALMTLQKPSLLAVITESADPAVCEALQRCGFIRADYRPFERSLVTHAEGSSSSQNALFVRADRVRERLTGAIHRNIVGVVV